MHFALKQPHSLFYYSNGANIARYFYYINIKPLHNKYTTKNYAADVHSSLKLVDCFCGFNFWIFAVAECPNVGVIPVSIVFAVC